MTGKPNRVLEVRGANVIVGTTNSPEGQPVPIEWVQGAIDRLLDEQELEINPQSVGYRSAFVGEDLLTLPGVKRATNPRRVRLVDEPTTARPPIQVPAAAPGRSRPAPADLEAALEALQRVPVKVKLPHYESLRDMSRPGLYSWWVDESGAEQVSRGLQATIEAGLVYVG